MLPTWLATANTRVSGTGEPSLMVRRVGSGVTLSEGRRVTQRAQVAVAVARVEGQKPIIALDNTRDSI